MSVDGPAQSTTEGAAPGKAPEDPTASERSGSEQAEADRSGSERATRAASHRKPLPEKSRRRQAFAFLLTMALLGIVVGGGYVVYRTFFAVPDFDGSGTGSVVVAVHDGDSTTQIGTELTDRGVVADPRAFTRAAADDPRVRSVQPGFYQLREHMSGESAVALILDPAARLGQLDLRGGVQLDDTRAPDGSVTPGVLSQISHASCHTEDGAERCLSVPELRTAMETTDLAKLGVPDWARDAVAKAEPRRRLEGLLQPGRYDVEPGKPAVEVLRTLLDTSNARLAATGIVAGARASGASPYDALVLASLVEKEASTPDMPKVSRVIHNRLGAGQRLELDSTVNYPLDVQALRTNDAERAKPGPYNTYQRTGLPPTPIGAPGRAAITATLHPVPGDWLFFVRCRTDGTSCFARTLDEHTANIELARKNGAF